MCHLPCPDTVIACWQSRDFIDSGFWNQMLMKKNFNVYAVYSVCIQSVNLINIFALYNYCFFDKPLMSLTFSWHEYDIENIYVIITIEQIKSIC